MIPSDIVFCKEMVVTQGKMWLQVIVLSIKPENAIDKNWNYLDKTQHAIMPKAVSNDWRLCDYVSHHNHNCYPVFLMRVNFSNKEI